jgi:hypothetical protein
MQDVNPTSELTMLDFPTVGVEEAVTLAMENRNELYTGAFSIYTALQDLNQYKYYPKSSAKYLTAYKNYTAAENDYDRKEASIRIEVRMNYAKMQSAKNQYYEAEKSYSEGVLNYNLAVLTYELSTTVGMSSY